MNLTKIKSSLLSALIVTTAVVPQVSWADDECGPGPIVTCAGNQPDGVTYNSAVDFEMTTSGSINAGTVGFDVTTTDAASLNFTQGGSITGTGGVDLVTEAGDITILNTGNFNVNGGLRASASGGDINVTLTPGNSFLAELTADTSGGAGATTMNLSRRVTALNMINGSGEFVINLIDNNPDSAPFGGFNNIVRTLTTSGGGTGVINLRDDTSVDVFDLSPDTGGAVQVNIGGRVGANSVGSIWARGSGAGEVTFVNDLQVRGGVDFSAATGAVTIVNNSDRPLGNPGNGGWWFAGASLLGAGNDVIVNASRATVASEPVASIDFGAGDDSIVNDGRFIVGRGAGTPRPGTLTLTNLETFENNSVIYMGTLYGTSTDLGVKSDGTPGSRLVAQGTNFIAGPNSRIALDAALAELAQPDCTTAEAADCVDFTGGTTSGTTLLTLSDARPAASSAAFNEGMVIIQGASAAEHFVLDPNSRGYVANTSTGPAIQKGLVTYRFTYDETAKQHTLTGVLADEGAQGGTFMALAQEVWRTSADTWFDRQAQLRSSSGGGEGTAGLWTTLNVNRGERDLMRSVDIGGNAYDYNLQQDIAITHLAFGGDILRGTTDAGAWNFGGTAGYVFSTVDYDATQLELEVGGFAAGFYGSYLAGPLSVDGLLNYTLATQSLESTNMGLGPDTRLRSDYSTLGARVDVAWKLAFGEALYLQPLASVSKSSTDADDMEVPNEGGSFQFDGDSTRLGVGFRTGLQSRLLGLNTGVDLTARWWNESDAENKTVVTIPNGNTETPLVDDFGGDFTELALGLNLSNDSGAFSGFINLKSQMATDYDMVGASAGFRFQW